MTKIEFINYLLEINKSGLARVHYREFQNRYEGFYIEPVDRKRIAFIAVWDMHKASCSMNSDIAGDNKKLIRYDDVMGYMEKHLLEA